MESNLKTHRCLSGGEPFDFILKQYDLNGKYLHDLIIEGCCRVIEGRLVADVDEVYYENKPIKRVLDVNGGSTLYLIDANNYVRENFVVKDEKSYKKAA